MKAYFYTLENFSCFDFGENRSLAVETSRSSFFRRMIKNLKGITSEECETGLFEKDKPLTEGKDYFLFLDYFDTETLTKAMNTKVLKSVSSVLEKDPEKFLEYNALLTSLYSFVLSRLDEEEISFTSDGERSFEEALKFFSVSVVQSREDIFGKLLNLIEIVGRLRLVKLLVLVNAKCFFEERELSEIFKMAKYRNLPLFLLDNRILGHKISDETLLTVDEDFFEKIY